MKKITFFPVLFIFIAVLSFFYPVYFQGKVPIPADTIVGLYHPFRDVYSHEYPRGIPFKNFLITDPVRQQYPWRKLVINSFANFQLPAWNPYNFAGSPLLANFQSAAFYPFNVIFIFLPFVHAWTVLVIMQLLLSSLFMYLYIRNLGLSKYAGVVSAISFSFSGFFISWLEWNTVIQTALWLPLILLAKDKLVRKTNLKWIIILVFAEISQFFAGHLQIWFYSQLVSNIYLGLRIWEVSSEKSFHLTFRNLIKKYIPFLLIGLLVLIVSSIQWIPTFQFILHSARNVDINWLKDGWFIPWQHALQVIVPDFFGNPSTLNYWGVWNYGEFVSYIGIFPLIMAFYALFTRFDKKTFFYGSIFFLSLLFAFPTLFAKLPFLLSIPFLSTAQPTRLIFLIDFSLAILAGLGLDYYLKSKKNIIWILVPFVLVFMGIWLFVLLKANNIIFVADENLEVAKRNLYLPTIILITTIIVFLTQKKLHKRLIPFSVGLLLFITFLDLFRYASKYNTFSNLEYIFPSSKVISFLQKNSGNFRIMTTDSRILPPNFSSIYHIQSVDGYDPLYLNRYGRYIAAAEMNTPETEQKLTFNRIITPHRYISDFENLLGVKYVVSLSPISSPSMQLVFQEGETKIYENKNVLPRAFFVKQTLQTESENDAFNKLFLIRKNFLNTAVIEFKKFPETNYVNKKWMDGQAEIIYYSSNKVIIKTNVLGNGDEKGFLVLTDIFYPTWRAKIFNDELQYKHEGTIIPTDFIFRGVIVPHGRHIVVFYTSLF